MPHVYSKQNIDTKWFYKTNGSRTRFLFYMFQGKALACRRSCWGQPSTNRAAKSVSVYDKTKSAQCLASSRTSFSHSHKQTGLINLNIVWSLEPLICRRKWVCKVNGNLNTWGSARQCLSTSQSSSCCVVAVGIDLLCSVLVRFNR